MILKGLLLQVAKTSFINQVRTPPNSELIIFLNIRFSMSYLHMLHIIKFPFNILKFLSFYFQNLNFLLPLQQI